MMAMALFETVVVVLLMVVAISQIEMSAFHSKLLVTYFEPPTNYF